jgi:cytochrome b subunit of formate dehydrogenase
VKPDRPWLTSNSLDKILEENISPVARMRLFSTGVGINHRIFSAEQITGDKGCLACGNCIDACPVVRDKKRFVFLHNQRTSMSLENIVDVECRRCYACVRVCPQVSKTVTEYVLGFRRVEKMVHILMIIIWFALAATGIFIYHYGQDIPSIHRTLYRYFHIFMGVALIFVPVLYYLMDKKHFKRAFVNAYKFGSEDIKWVKDLWAHLKNPNRYPMPFWGEFNTYQKFWYVYISFALPVLALTGVIKIIFGLNDTATYWLTVVMGIHITVGVCSDILVFLHIYLKYLKNMARICRDMLRAWRSKKSLLYPFLYDNKEEIYSSKAK